jgi:hypothetical protein
MRYFMINNSLARAIWLSVFWLCLASYPALAQDDISAPLTQQDIDKFVSVYGTEDPVMAAKSDANLNPDRLSVVANRLSAVYVLRGQNTEEAALLKKLSAIKDPHAVNPDEYALYRANNQQLKPVFAKFLGAYTLRLPNSIAEQESLEASNDNSYVDPNLDPTLDPNVGNFDFDPSEGYGPPPAGSGPDNSQPTINTENLPAQELVSSNWEAN